MSRWQKSSAKQLDRTSAKKVIRERACKVCGSTKWVCSSDDHGRTWTCWGHRKDATKEERDKEDARQLKEKNSKLEGQRKSERYKREVSRKRHGRSYTPKDSQYDWFFD